jgi:regulator of protease activity HflC (stomatin/prohibitin superfamily)
MMRRFKIARRERGFLYKGRDYVRYLRPGTHWVFGFGYRVEVAAVTDMALHSKDLELLAKDPALWEDLAFVELREHERALVWSDGRLRCVLVPGRAAFWKALREVKVEVHDARTIRFAHEALAQVLVVPGAQEALEAAVVPPGATGLLMVDEKVREELGPGTYALWRGVARARIEVVDRREQALEVGGQEVLTKDKATLRLNVVATFRVTEPRTWLEGAQDSRGSLYREVQLAARKAVSARTLDELLSEKESVARELEAAVAARAAALGARTQAVELKDVILPGDMRALMNQVLEAEKRAQANLIARREETAATRALLNTAKLYADHPALLRLKELETAEKVAEKVSELRVGNAGEILDRLLPRKS